MRKIINISVPESAKRYVERRVAEEHFGSVSEYFRELIRLDQKRTRATNQSFARADYLRRQSSTIQTEDLTKLFAQKT